MNERDVEQLAMHLWDITGLYEDVEEAKLDARCLLETGEVCLTQRVREIMERILDAAELRSDMKAALKRRILAAIDNMDTVDTKATVKREGIPAWDRKRVPKRSPWQWD